MTEPQPSDAPTGSNEAAPDSATSRNFAYRLASTVVLVPLALLCTYFGGWLFVGVCGLAAAAILWEWTGLVTGRADPRILTPGLGALAVAAMLAGERQGAAASGVVVLGAFLAGGMVMAWPRRFPAVDYPLWAGGGVIYAGAGLLGPALLRGDPQWGLVALLFLFAIVWATDILAYLVGRAVGGPLLWPRLSPKKTWAGAVGGLIGGVAAGALVAYASGGIKPVAAGTLALVLSILAQGGDLFESAVKRRFGAKDAGTLIPGHGGVMDRLDGFLVAALVAVVIGFFRHSLAAPAQGLLLW